MKYLIDTCVISETQKPSPDRNVLAWFASVRESDLCFSAVVFGEIEKGIELLPNGSRKARLVKWLESCHVRYGAQILPFDSSVAREWGRLTAKLQKKGLIKPVADSQIAATALCHNLTLVTRNTKDFAQTGVKLLNPFE